MNPSRLGTCLKPSECGRSETARRRFCLIHGDPSAWSLSLPRGSAPPLAAMLWGSPGPAGAGFLLPPAGLLLDEPGVSPALPALHPHPQGSITIPTLTQFSISLRDARLFRLRTPHGCTQFLCPLHSPHPAEHTPIRPLSSPRCPPAGPSHDHLDFPRVLALVLPDRPASLSGRALFLPGLPRLALPGPALLCCSRPFAQLHGSFLSVVSVVSSPSMPALVKISAPGGHRPVFGPWI